MRLVLANPRGFCAGVERAITVVEDLLDRLDEPVYIRHDIVHNRVVVDGLRSRGAIFVEQVAEIPYGAVAVVSAHGVPPSVYDEAKRRRLRLIDATCPLVSKVHLEVSRHARQGRAVVVIGHRDHVEVHGIVGYYDQHNAGGICVVETEEEARNLIVPTPDHVGYVTQTTLAVDQTRRIVDMLRARFPNLVGPHSQDICYATQNRQDAVRRLAGICDLILVIGAPHSSNSVRLCEVAAGMGVEARLYQRPAEIEPEWLRWHSVVGLTLSASAPEHLVEATIARVQALCLEVVVEEIGEPEQVSFRLPVELNALAAGASEGPLASIAS